MHNKISALTLALLVTTSGFALELTPGENIIQQDAVSGAKIAENNAPRYRYINTHFGIIESTLKENSKKLELLVKETVFDHGTIIAPFTAVMVPCVGLLFSKDNKYFLTHAIIFGAAEAFYLCRNNKTQTDSMFYKHAHDTTINLEKDEHGNWTVLNSTYDQELNEHLAQTAAAIEKDDVLNTAVFAKLEKIFAARQS